MKMYIKEYYPYFILLIIINVSILFISYIDPLVPMHALIYIVLINLFITAIAVGIDFNRKKEFYRSIRKLEKHEEIDYLPSERSAFQQDYFDVLRGLKQEYNKMVEIESNRTKENLDEMTRFIHDLKMPLTTMQLMINDLKEEDRSKILTEWQRLDQKLNEILYLKRLPNIENDLHFEMIKIPDIVNQSIRKLRTICLHKGIGFDIHFNVTEVVSDVKWVTFVIDQLISNAVKYSENNDIEIRTTMADGYVIFSIKDYGRGIKEADIKRIFDAGFTSTSDKNDNQSTGMGLYLAAQASNALEIEIDVESVYGAHTIFVLTFPKLNHMTEIRTM
ncbi:MAG TPA: sensor histidine kinase [Aliicoccus persicus]|uniref:histidine kinase n=1 Tax=Aliicoccus persicus TaxID=930138 RepID=A0A921JBD8_9STAP|nr:sensor histidine kinase [Aliicoccus persicus]